MLIKLKCVILAVFSVLIAALLNLSGCFSQHLSALNSSGEVTLLPLEQQEWLHIDDGVFWIYASYWEHRVREHKLTVEELGQPPYVRVLLIGPFSKDFPKSQLRPARCEFHYAEVGFEPVSTQVVGLYAAHMDDIYPENLSRPYFVYCRAPVGLSRAVPRAMALVTPNQAQQPWAHDMSGSVRKWLVPIRGDPFTMHPPFASERRKCLTCP